MRLQGPNAHCGFGRQLMDYLEAQISGIFLRWILLLMFGVTSHKAANSTSGMDIKILKPSGFFRYHQV